MRGVLAPLTATRSRSVWVADSFEGLPKPDAGRYPPMRGDVNYTAEELAVSLEEVRANFERYGLLDDRVRFVEGWFRDTLPRLADRRWAVIRLDGDLYESTMDGLLNLYPQLSVGGYLIVDDYGFDNCRRRSRTIGASTGSPRRSSGSTGSAPTGDAASKGYLAGKPRFEIALLATILLGGAALRFSQVGQSLFGDELWSWVGATDPSFGGMLDWVEGEPEITPPLFTALAWISVRLGDDRTMIDLPSLVAGIATIALVFGIARILAGRRVALIAAAFAALSPTLSFFAVEARAIACRSPSSPRPPW